MLREFSSHFLHHFLLIFSVLLTSLHKFLPIWRNLRDLRKKEVVITTIILNTWGTLMSSDGRNPPIHMKHRSAGVFHMPETIWNTSVLATMLLRFIASSKCAKQLSTKSRSSFSGKCSCTAVRSSDVIRWCSSSHLAYSMSKTAASKDENKKWFNNDNKTNNFEVID